MTDSPTPGARRRTNAYRMGQMLGGMVLVALVLTAVALLASLSFIVIRATFNI